MFAKVFDQIFDSSIAENYKVRFVFEDMLKLANIDGVVDMTHEAIARRTNVPLALVKHGIEELEKADPRSRNAEHEGRRLVRLDEHRDWGWLIVNYQHYRELASEEQRREKTRERVARFRQKKQRVTHSNAPATKANDSPSSSASTSSSLKGESERDLFWPKWETPRFKAKFLEWREIRTAMGKKPKSWFKMFQEQLIWLSQFSESIALEILSQSIRNGWQGLFEPKTTNPALKPKIGRDPDELMSDTAWQRRNAKS